MPRIAVGIEYDGAAFSGWQTQRQLRTVQGELTAALSSVADEPVSLLAAGRTDAGVHAVGQIAHFDTTALRSPRAWILGANTLLLPAVNLTWAREVPQHFHARFSAESRSYCYLILNRRARSALAHQRAAHVHVPLDVERMQAGARQLLGEHDFSAFRAMACQSRSPQRRLDRLAVRRSGDWLIIDATANAFLHHMVRNLVGMLLAIGRGDREPEDARRVLQSRDRAQCAAMAPATGLYFWHAEYSAAFALPAAPARSAMIPAL